MSTDNCESSNFLKRACNPAGDSGGGGGGGSTSPGGSNTQVQYNNAGSFGGSSDFTYDGDKVSIKTLLVTGEAYIEHAEDLYIGDPLITLNSGVTAPNTYDIGFIGDRGASDNIGLIWDESADTFAFIQTTDNGSTIGNVPIDSYKSIKAGDVGGTGVGDRITLNGTPYLLSGDAVEGAAGSTNQIQYNNGGSFAGSNDLTWDGSQLSVSGTLEVVDDSDAQILAKGWSPDSVGNDGGAIQLGEAATYHGMLSYDNAGSTLYIDNAYNNSNGKIHFRTKTSSTAITGLTIDGDGNVGIGTSSPDYTLDVSGDVGGTGVGDRITLNGTPYLLSGDASAGGIGYTDLSVTVNSAGTANLAYNNTNGVFTYTPPDLSTYVTSSETGIFVTTSQTGDFVTSSETGIFVTTSQTGDFVTSSETGIFVTTSQTGDFVTTGDSNLTGKVLGYDLKAGETFSDGDVIKWESSSNSWLLTNAGGGGDTSASGNNTNIQYNNGGSFAGSDNFTWDGTAVFVSGNLELENTIGPFIDFKDTNTDYQVRIGQDNTNSNQLNVSASGGDGDFWVQRRAYLGFADVGSWPASAGYAFFGHGSLNHQALGNYALLQDPGGETYINAAETKGIHFRTGNHGPSALGDLVHIKGGMGVGMDASGTHGSIVASNDIVAFASSDQRLKDNVTPIANGLDKVLQITGVEFDWNEDAYEHLAGHDVGVIAQNIESVLPEVVATRPDGYKAVRYEKMVPLLIEAIKDQQEQIDQLKEAIQQS